MTEIDVILVELTAPDFMALGGCRTPESRSSNPRELGPSASLLWWQGKAYAFLEVVLPTLRALGRSFPRRSLLPALARKWSAAGSRRAWSHS